MPTYLQLSEIMHALSKIISQKQNRNIEENKKSSLHQMDGKEARFFNDKTKKKLD